MSRIYKAFENGPALIGFLTGGDPDVAATGELIREMARAGADLIEIGIPFSDPVAEGPAIQAASARALAAGAAAEPLFGLVAELRQDLDIPIVFVTYLNPVFRYGYDAFFARCRACGVDGIVVPDLPYEEQHEVKGTAAQYGVSVITIIAPTSKQRIDMLAPQAEGFVYAAFPMETVGAHGHVRQELRDMLAGIRAKSPVPVAVEFGSCTPELAKELSGAVGGVIVGSAAVELVERYGKAAGPQLYEFIKLLKDAIR